MPFVLRVTTLPSLAEIARVPQIVIVDQTGQAVSLGTSPGICMLVGEFLKGSTNTPTEVTSNGQVQALFGGISALLSQSAAGAQDGSGAAYNGNGMLQLKSKTFKRLGITRVDTEAVSTDGGTTISTLTLTLTIAAADQTAGVTNKDIFIPAGTRFADAALNSATVVLASSQDYTIKKGATVASNQVTLTGVRAFFVLAPATVVVTAIGAVDTVIDAALQNVDAGTTISAVTNPVAMWPPGTGTSLAARVASRYTAAITATLPGGDVTSDIVVIWSARRSTAIRAATLQNAVDSSASGRGRIACLSAEPAAGTDAAAAAAAITAAAGLASGENLRKDRAIIAFPHTKIAVDELGGISVLINPDGWMASILSNFANERNPGANPAGLMDAIVSAEDCFVSNPPQKGDYENLIAGGVSPILKDRRRGWKFLDGVTAVDPVADPTRVPAKRRRMADEIQDSVADIAAPFNNEPATQVEIDTFTSELEGYLERLLSPNDPSKQRIVGYTLDPVSGNTPDLLGVGVFTLIFTVRTLSDFRDIILQSRIGETVTLPAAA